MPRCATPSPASGTPEQRRDLLLRGCPADDLSRRLDRAGIELLDAAGVLEHPAVLANIDSDFLDTGSGPWWYATVDWSGLRAEPEALRLGGTAGLLLRLAVSIAAGDLVNLRDIVCNLDDYQTRAVEAAVATASGIGDRTEIIHSPSRADRLYVVPRCAE